MNGCRLMPRPGVNGERSLRIEEKEAEPCHQKKC